MACPTDTIAALATPVGTSALALLRASGPLCADIARKILGRVPAPRRVFHGDYLDRDGRLLDDVLATFFPGPHSYTGDDTLEISSHGNPFIAQKILEDLFARGCRPAEAGEFTERAFLNGRLDLSQAEAVMDLISARSERALEAANQQLRGSLGRHLAALTDELVDALARVEAYLDFPDEDLPEEDQKLVRTAVGRARDGAERLLATRHYGELLRDGMRTVIIGEPNAGKSSLLNRLVGHERALVSAEPGTTRDFIEERIMVGPFCIRLIDTAGLNPSPGPLEKRGMEKTLERASEADLFLMILDSTRPPPPFPAELTDRLKRHNALLVLNKIDLKSAGSVPSLLFELETVRVSALIGTGFDQLSAAIIQRAEAFRQDEGEELIAINARHADALGRARFCLQSALTQIDEHGPGELIASDLRDALAAFGEIGGRIDNEQVLDLLFSTFCIGK